MLRRNPLQIPWVHTQWFRASRFGFQSENKTPFWGSEDSAADSARVVCRPGVNARNHDGCTPLHFLPFAPAQATEHKASAIRAALRQGGADEALCGRSGLWRGSLTPAQVEAWAQRWAPVPPTHLRAASVSQSA